MSHLIKQWWLRKVNLPRSGLLEQGTRPDTVNRTTKLRLLARPPEPVSTAIRQNKTKL